MHLPSQQLFEWKGIISIHEVTDVEVRCFKDVHCLVCFRLCSHIAHEPLDYLALIITLDIDPYWLLYHSIELDALVNYLVYAHFLELLLLPGPVGFRWKLEFGWRAMDVFLSCQNSIRGHEVSKLLVRAHRHIRIPKLRIIHWCPWCIH